MIANQVLSESLEYSLLIRGHRVFPHNISGCKAQETRLQTATVAALGMQYNAAHTWQAEQCCVHSAGSTMLR